MILTLSIVCSFILGVVMLSVSAYVGATVIGFLFCFAGVSLLAYAFFALCALIASSDAYDYEEL